MANVLESEITNQCYINFLKAGLGLREVQRGLHPYITQTLQVIHRSLITRVGGASCGVCTLDTVQLHLNCRKKGCLCQKNPAQRRPCPTSTCDRLYNEVVNLCLNGKPQFQNTVLWQVYTDPWELGKCFLPLAGYDRKASAAECDATGLLNIIVFCTEMASSLGVAIRRTLPKDVFHEVKDIRNKIMHSTDLELMDGDMKSALDKMIQVLRYGQDLQNDSDAKDAAERIQKLKDGTEKITRQMEKDVIQEKFNAIQEDIVSLKRDTSKQQSDSSTHDMEIQQLKDGMEKVTRTMEKDVPQKLEAHQVDIDALKNDSSIHDVQIKQLQDLVTTLQKKIMDPKDKVKTAEESSGTQRENLNITVSHHVLKLDGRRDTGQDRFGPIQHAAQQGDVETLKTLVNQGNDPMCLTPQEQTLLHIAAGNGQHQVVEYLCREYPDMIFQTTQLRWTAAHKAAEYGDPECIETLIKHRTDPMCLTSSQFTLLHIAALNGRQSVVRYLCSKYPDMINQVGKLGWYPAHLAVQNGHIKCLEILIDQGTYPLCRTSDGCTLLHVASIKGRTNVVKYLCTRYPDMVNMTCKRGWYPAHFAAQEGHVQCLETLINHGTDPMCQTSDQVTLLHVAVLKGRQYVVEYLCRNYPHLTDIKDKNGFNPAYVAVENNQLQYLDILNVHF